MERKLIAKIREKIYPRDFEGMAQKIEVLTYLRLYFKSKDLSA